MPPHENEAPSLPTSSTCDPQSDPQTHPGEVTSAKVIAATERIVAMVHPVAVIAFGSRARGDHRPDSDLDLAVILENFDPTEDQWPLWRADIREWMPIDVLVAGRDRHEFMRNSMISVHYDIETEGVILYDARVGSVDRRAVERLTR